MNHKLLKQCVAEFRSALAGLIYGRFFIEESK
jgi:hypothetical protein